MTSSRWNRVAGVVALVAALAVTGLAAEPSAADETTIGYSPLRTNWDDQEPGLVSTAVTQPDFGQLWSTKVDGTTTANPNSIYGQPLVVGNLVIVVTEENTVEALNSATGKRVWSDVNLGGAPWTPFSGCGDLVPHVGITSTPVYDPATKLVYLVAKYQAPHGAATMKMHALSPTTGKEATGWPLTLAGRSLNGNEPFDATTANQRPGLLLMGGDIYFATASHCDREPYVGFVGRVTTGPKPTLKLWSSESGAATDEAGIWQSGGGLVSDGPGRIFFATGNGISPTAAKGSAPPKTLGESVVRLAVNANGSMTAKDFFSPANNDALDQDDADLGSSGPVALPDSFGSSADPHLLVQAGKSGAVYLLDRDDLGGDAQGPGGTDDVVSSLTGNGVWGHAGVFDGGAGKRYLYLMPSDSPLEALQVAPNTRGVPTLSTAATSPQSYGYTSGSPVVTSDGSNAATALVWVDVVDNSSGANGKLVAYPAVPPTDGSAWKPVATFPLGTMSKFTQPATDGGHLYVGTRDGRVLAFGSPTTGAITASPFTFADQPVGGTEQGSVTLTANTAATVTAVTTSPGDTFTAGQPDPAVGTPLHQGDTVSVPVTYDARSVGTTSGTLSVTATNASGTVTFPFSLSGTATQPGIAANPRALSFGNVAVGQGSQLGLTIHNTGTTAENITSVSSPAAPFSLVSPPKLPYQLPALGSVTLPVQFSPTKAVTSTQQLVVGTDAESHNTATVTVQGTGFTGKPKLTYKPTSVVFGRLAPGTTSSQTVTITNTGTTTMTINKAAVPSAPFSVPTPVSEGQRVEPGDSLKVTITARPTNAERRIDRYSITTNDGAGPHLLPIELNTANPYGQIKGPLGCVTDYRRLRVNGNPITDAPCDGSQAQTWTFSTDHSIQLANKSDGVNCLDIRKAGTASGTPVQLHRCNRTVGQEFVPDSSGRLVNPHSKLCLNILHESAQPDSRLMISRCGVSPSEQWDTTVLLHARGELSSGLGSVGQYCITDPGNSAAAGTPMQLSACTLAPGQLITHEGATLRAAGQCFTMAQPARGSGVWLQQCSGSSIQVFTTAANGRLYNPATKLCLDVPKGSRANGTPLQGYTCNGTRPQRWTLPG